VRPIWVEEPAKKARMPSFIVGSSHNLKNVRLI
jgi:hypothetical protein